MTHRPAPGLRLSVVHRRTDICLAGARRHVVALQNDCGDPSFVIDRMTKKKKKPDAE